MFSYFYYLLSWQLVIVYTVDLYSKFSQHDYNIKFTRLELLDYSKELFESYKIVTFKYNRTVAVANLTFKTKFSMNNDMQVITQAYKLYSNEYRIFPMRFQLNFCTCMERNLVGLKTSFTRCGNYSTDCIYKMGATYHVCNLTPDESRFPPLIPNGEYKLEYSLLFNNSIGAIINAYGEVYRAIK